MYNYISIKYNLNMFSDISTEKIMTTSQCWRDKVSYCGYE